MSESGASSGFRSHRRSLRWKMALLASLSSVSVVEPDFNTSRRSVSSVIGIARLPRYIRSTTYLAKGIELGGSCGQDVAVPHIRQLVAKNPVMQANDPIHLWPNPAFDRRSFVLALPATR